MKQSKITIVNDYSVGAEIKVELPEGKTVDDIKHVWFKWGEGSIEFKDGTFMLEIEEEDQYHDNPVNFKRPITTKIFDEDFNEVWEKSE